MYMPLSHAFGASDAVYEQKHVESMSAVMRWHCKSGSEQVLEQQNEYLEV